MMVAHAELEAWYAAEYERLVASDLDATEREIQIQALRREYAARLAGPERVA